MAPFGIPKFDNGERFDLRLPYVEQGWVDEEADASNWFRKLFSKKKDDKTKDNNEDADKK